MPQTKWKRQITGLAPIMASYYDDVTDFYATRDAVVALFKADQAFDTEDHDKFTDAVMMLEGAEDIEEFDEWLDEIYDWADDELIWISPNS